MKKLRERIKPYVGKVYYVKTMNFPSEVQAYKVMSSLISYVYVYSTQIENRVINLDINTAKNRAFVEKMLQNIETKSISFSEFMNSYRESRAEIDEFVTVEMGLPI